MGAKQLTAWSGTTTESKPSTAARLHQWLRSECRWATRMTRELTDSKETTTNGQLLAEGNFFMSLFGAMVLIDNVGFLGMAAIGLWVAASFTLLKKGGLR